MKLRHDEIIEIHNYWVKLKSKFGSLAGQAFTYDIDRFIKTELSEFNNILSKYRTGISLIVARNPEGSVYQITGFDFASCCGMYVLDHLDQYLKVWEV